MKRTIAFMLLGAVLVVGVGCEDQVTSVQQKDEVHESPARMEPAATMLPVEQLPPAARFPGAPPGVTAQQALMAKRAAELDAYRHLAEQIMGMRIDSRTYVKDFVAESDTITTDLNARVLGLHWTRIEFPPGAGICTVEGVVGLSKIITYFRSLSTRHFKGDHLKAFDYDTMKRVNKKTLITVTGEGAIKGR